MVQQSIAELTQDKKSRSIKGHLVPGIYVLLSFSLLLSTTLEYAETEYAEAEYLSPSPYSQY